MNKCISVKGRRVQERKTNSTKKEEKTERREEERGGGGGGGGGEGEGRGGGGGGGVNGVDSMAIIGLLREFPFTLQVEDPARAWKNPPSRYLRLANRYRSLLPPGSRFMMDINVVNDRDVQETHLPLSLTTGVELAATVRAAGRPQTVSLSTEMLRSG